MRAIIPRRNLLNSMGVGAALSVAVLQAACANHLVSFLHGLGCMLLDTLYVYRVDQTQCLILCCMLSEMSLTQQGVAVMLCHLGWRTLL